METYICTEIAGRGSPATLRCAEPVYLAREVDAEIARLKAEADLLKAALRWCLENGVVMAIHHVDGKPYPRLVYNGDYDNATPPPEFAAVIAEAVGSKTAESGKAGGG